MQSAMSTSNLRNDITRTESGIIHSGRTRGARNAGQALETFFETMISRHSKASQADDEMELPSTSERWLRGSMVPDAAQEECAKEMSYLEEYMLY